MVIRDEKEYKDYEARMEKLIERGTELVHDAERSPR